MMSRLLRAGVLAGGLLAAGAGVAHADETTCGQGGLLAGNQVLAPVTVPITANGDAVSVLGLDGRQRGSSPAGSAGTTTAPTSIPALRTSGRHSLGSGNQVLVPVPVPVTFGGDAIALLGRSDARGHSGAVAGPSSTGPSSSGLGSSGLSSTGLSSMVVGDSARSDAGDSAATSPAATSPAVTSPDAATSGAGVLGLHLASAADAAPTTASLAMTGARPLPLVAAGIVIVITGVLLWRGRHPGRERDF